MFERIPRFFVYDLEHAPVSVGAIPFLGDLALRYVVMEQRKPVGNPDTDAWGGQTVAFCPTRPDAERISTALNYVDGVTGGDF